MIGVVGDGPLVRAARSAGLELGAVRDGVAGVIVDVPLAQRAQTVLDVSAGGVPLLVEAPVAAAAADARRLNDVRDVVSVNELRYALHTRRLVEELQKGQDALETLFVAWRARVGSVTESMLPVLLDYVRELSPARVERVSAMQRSDPFVMTVTLRYAGGVLGSLEIGAHLPATFPSVTELVIECFSRESVLHCIPGRHAVEVVGQSATDWQPDPFVAAVNGFAAWLDDGDRPPGGVQRDVAALELAENIREAADAGSARILGD
jgi:predicted dehydrogenase